MFKRNNMNILQRIEKGRTSATILDHIVKPESKAQVQDQLYILKSQVQKGKVQVWTQGCHSYLI